MLFVSIVNTQQIITHRDDSTIQQSKTNTNTKTKRLMVQSLFKTTHSLSPTPSIIIKHKNIPLLNLLSCDWYSHSDNVDCRTCLCRDKSTNICVARIKGGGCPSDTTLDWFNCPVEAQRHNACPCTAEYPCRYYDRHNNTCLPFSSNGTCDDDTYQCCDPDATVRTSDDTTDKASGNGTTSLISSVILVAVCILSGSMTLVALGFSLCYFVQRHRRPRTTEVPPIVPTSSTHVESKDEDSVQTTQEPSTRESPRSTVV